MASPSLESLNAELTLSIIDFLPVTESCRLCQVTKRLYYLVHQHRVLRGPELVCVKSHTWNNSSLDVYRDALTRMHCPPQLVLFFSGLEHCSLAEDLPLRASEFPAPREAAVLGCESEDPIQTIHCCDSRSDDALECDDNVSVMVLGGLPEDTTKIQPFLVQDPFSDSEEGFLPLLSDDADWKTFIIFSSPETPAHLVTRLQEKFPKALIIGGYCVSAVGYLPREMSEYRRSALRYRYHLAIGEFPPREMTVETMCNTIRQREGSILQTATVCGVALAGDIPFHAVVSRGLESLTSKEDFVVSRSDFYSVADKPYHLVSEVVNRSSGARIPLSGAQFWQRFGADTVGIRYPHNDGFTVFESVYDDVDGLVICTFDEKSIAGCPIDTFRFTKESMLVDVEQSMERLRASLGNQEILGALMISCCGRGPTASSMLGEEMADAKRFAAAFPGVPCLGWYAGGEIGPSARARQATLFRTGEACIQGYTAVFGVFIVPQADTTTWTVSDDTPTAINDFLKIRLRTSPQRAHAPCL